MFKKRDSIWITGFATVMLLILIYKKFFYYNAAKRNRKTV